MTIEYHSTRRIAELVEIKKNDFRQDFAQATVQIELSLICCKYKADEIDDEYDINKVWEIMYIWWEEKADV